MLRGGLSKVVVKKLQAVTTCQYEMCHSSISLATELVGETTGTGRKLKWKKVIVLEYWISFHSKTDSYNHIVRICCCKHFLSVMGTTRHSRLLTTASTAGNKWKDILRGLTGIPPKHLIKNYQSSLSLGAKLRDGVISRDTIQDYCCVLHIRFQGCLTLCPGLALTPLWPENICYPRVSQQPPITYVRYMKEDDVNLSFSSGLLTLHAMEGVNCFVWSSE